MTAIKKLGKKEYLAQQEKMQKQRDRRAWKDEGPLAMPEILKKLKIARDAWGPSYSAKGYSPYASPTAGQEGYREILKEKLRFLNAGYGKDAKYSYGDPMKHFNDPKVIETLLGYDIVDKPIPPLVSGPSHFDLMRKDGVPVLSQEEIYAQQPPGGVGGGGEAGLSYIHGFPWPADHQLFAGTSLGTSSYDVPTERDFMVDLTQGYGPEGFQNVVDPDQLAGIRASTGSPDYLAGPQGTFTGDSYEGEWSPTQGALVEQPQLSPQNRFNDRSWISRIHSPEMLMRSGVNRLNRNRNW